MEVETTLLEEMKGLSIMEIAQGANEVAQQQNELLAYLLVVVEDNVHCQM